MNRILTIAAVALAIVAHACDQEKLVEAHISNINGKD
jgi:hypothetical protein